MHVKLLRILWLPAVIVACSESPVDPTSQIPISLSIVGGDNQTGLPGETLPEPLVVQVESSNGPAPQQVVNWVVVEGGGRVYAGVSLTDRDGYAQEWWTLGEEGPQRLEVRAVDPTTGERLLHAVFTATASSSSDDDDPPGDDDDEGDDDGDDDTGGPPPPPPGQWDRALADTTIQGNLVVPSGQRWLIGRNVQVAGNVLVQDATLGMRPGSSLKFVGANPDQYVGGGMHYRPEYDKDIGLWVWGSGELDIACTPTTGWNRTGSDPTWRSDDEYWIAPTDHGDFKPRRWFPGDPIPRVDPRVPAAEVINVTRDCVIEGPGHIHIHSSKPQRIEYVRLEAMGVSNAAHQGPVMGRYALHLHFSGEGSRGTVIRGVAAVNSRGTVYVPHESHGITMVDNVSVNSWAEALWWDPGEHANDLLVDGLAVSGVSFPESIMGQKKNVEGVTLGSGHNMTIVNSAVSGVHNPRHDFRAIGFHWNTKSAHNNPAKWTFVNNVSHNNEGFGIRFWFNDKWAHHVQDSELYRNGTGGIENGAYGNSVRYSNTLLLENHILHHSSSNEQEHDGLGSRYTNVQVYAASGPAVVVGRLRATAKQYTEFIDCVLEPGPGAPKVDVTEAKIENKFLAVFRRCGVTPDDIVFPSSIPSALNGTHVLIEHEDGRKWEIRIENRQKIVKQL